MKENSFVLAPGTTFHSFTSDIYIVISPQLFWTFESCAPRTYYLNESFFLILEGTLPKHTLLSFTLKYYNILTGHDEVSTALLPNLPF